MCLCTSPLLCLLDSSSSASQKVQIRLLETRQFFKEDQLLALPACARAWRPTTSWRCKTLHHQSLYWPEGPQDGTLSITGSLVVRGVIILTVDSNKMLMRLFSFLPSCLHSPYNTTREPGDSTANIACHYDMAISIMRKHQAVAPGWSQQVSSDNVWRDHLRGFTQSPSSAR